MNGFQTILIAKSIAQAAFADAKTDPSSYAARDVVRLYKVADGLQAFSSQSYVEAMMHIEDDAIASLQLSGYVKAGE
jgi:flavoprotein